MALFKKDPFEHTPFTKRWLVRVFRPIMYGRYDGLNQLKIKGSDIIRSLPSQNVSFISNHQAYFTNVTAMYHVFNVSLKGRKDTLDNVRCLWSPKLNICYVATLETMKSGILPKVLGYTGTVPVNRTWHEKGKEMHREVRQGDVENIGAVLADDWVITFPQGTTSSWKPARKGAVHLVKQYKPIVVPIVIDGFRRSFDKKGINIKKKGVQQSVITKPSLRIDYENDTVEQIVAQIEMATEQHELFLKVRKLEPDNVLQVESEQ